MAQTGYDAEQPQPGDAAPKISGQRARQGQNIKGMLVVLIASVLLVSIAYGVMLALQQEPASVVNNSANEATSAPVQGQFPSSAEQATPQSSPLPETPPQPQQ